MAGDWIKMRVGIVQHPRVIALSEALSYDGDYQDWSGLHGFVPSVGGTKQEFDDCVTQALRVTRYVSVTALLRFWGYANEHSKDEFIPALRIQDIDEIVQVPGFGLALQSVGWVIYNEERKGVFLPNFSEHNATASDRTSAARQKRYRESKKSVTDSNGVTSNVTRNVTVTDREEKRREEKINKKNTLSGKPDDARQLAKELIDFLNAKAGKAFRHTDANLEPIIARMKEGFTVQDLKTVTVRKCRDWATDEKMAEYLRPATLYNRTKFNQYIGECVEVAE